MISKPSEDQIEKEVSILDLIASELGARPIERVVIVARIAARN